MSRSGLLLYLVRHGETADNAARIFQGQTGRGLNRLGQAQAARAAERLRRHGPAAIVASDLERAAETARIIGDACGLAVELDRGLREIDLGSWSGRGYDEVKDLYPEEWSAWESGLDVRRGGGETYAELAVRVEASIARIAAAASRPGARPGPVVVVSHGGAIKSWVASLLGVTSSGLRALAGVANAGLTIVERVRPATATATATATAHRLHAWNDTAHLEDLVVEAHSD